MNGGLVSALEYKSPEEVHGAIAGFWYFGIDDAARALSAAFDLAFQAGPIADAEARGDHLDALDDDIHARLEQMEDGYYAAVPHDDVLEAAFRERLRESPGDFTALE